MQTPGVSVDEAQLRHPLERPLFWIFVALNVAIAAAALFIVIKGSDWLAAHPLIAKEGTRIRALATAAILGLPAITFVRNTRHADLQGNSIRISPAQLPELDSILRSYCKRLGMNRVPELYFSDSAIKEAARAYTSWQDEYIVLSTRFLQPDLRPILGVLGFLLGRELGRLRLGHASWQTELLLSYVKRIPYLRNPLLRVFTYSEDRYGAYLAPNGVLGLVALSAGRLMLPAVNVADYLQQVRSRSGIWSRFTPLINEIPQTANRIRALYAAGLFRVEGSSTTLPEHAGGDRH